MIRTESAPKPGVRYTHRPGAYAILMIEGQVLVTFQRTPRAEFQLPGGGIDPGEGALRALHREVYEETGYRLTAPRRLGAHRRFVWMPDYQMYAEKVCHIYLARPTLRIGAPTEPEHKAIWMDAEEAVRQLSIPGDARFLDALLR